MKIILKELYLTHIIYLLITGRPSCGVEIIARAADEAMTGVASYGIGIAPLTYLGGAIWEQWFQAIRDSCE